MTGILYKAVLGICLLGLGWNAPAQQKPQIDEYRSLNGTGNNLDNATLGADIGSADTKLRRMTAPAYDDGMEMPRTLNNLLPSARSVSNALSAQTSLMPNSRLLSSFVWQWGQFIDHDLDLTGGMDPREGFYIPVPTGDPQFDPFATGIQEIGLNRSLYDPTTGAIFNTPREQMNQITHWLDASNVYGSDAERADTLRTFNGGMLKTSAGDLLPFNDIADPLANDRGPNGLITLGNDFIAGDIRANEQIGLTALHTLFVREHNRLAEAIAIADGALNDEEIYQIARRIVGAEQQAITYNEFLPALLGTDAVSSYTGYDATVDARIANEFSTAAYRFGHSMLVPELLRLDADGNPISEGSIALRNAFFNPDELIATGIEPILFGLSQQQAQEIDPQLVDDVRNFLFGPPGAGGFDLASLNIQRGRDHGLSSYNDVRSAFGLAPAATFTDITSEVEIAAALAGIYGSVDEVDLWVGGLAEDHLPNSSLGELFSTVIGDQFERLRDGDRFFYLNDPFFTDNWLLDAIGINDIDTIRLSDILSLNTAYGDFQDNVFFVSALNTIPEPTTWILLLSGLVWFAWRKPQIR